MLRNSVYAALFIAAIAACTEHPQGAENRFLFYAPEVQDVFIDKLKEHNLEYRVDGEGAVWYRVEDTEKVDQLKKQILDEQLGNQYSVSYAVAEEMQLFTGELEEQGIKYQVETRGTRQWVLWSQEDDEKVRQIQEGISDSILRLRAEKRKERGQQ